MQAPLLFVIAATALAMCANAKAETSTFSFGSGSPFGGSTVVGGVPITLTTTNTEPFGTSSFRDLLDQAPANVRFNFGTAITNFAVSISRVHPDEFIEAFSLGAPSQLSGTLILVNGRVTTSGTDDFGFGTLTWSSISASQVTFTIGNYPNPRPPLGPAISVDTFTIPSVPEPASTILLLFGLFPVLSVWRHRASLRRDA